MDDYVTQYSFKNAQDFLNALMPWSETFGGGSCVFRGHAEVDFKLVPQVLREGALARMESMSRAYARGNGALASASIFSAYYEYQLIRDFYKIADANGLYVPDSERLRKKIHHDVDIHTMASWVDGEGWLPDDMLEAAGLAQHYGVPTRLLDWTYDPLVAAFFASRDGKDQEGELCIWVLNQRELVLLEHHDTEWPLSFSQPHYEGNPNLAAQKGLFTHWRSPLDGVSTLLGKEKANSFHTLDRRSLEEQVRDYFQDRHRGCPHKVFWKLTLPRSETSKLARLLRKLNYGPARIFPGYEGVALEMAERGPLREAKGVEE